MKTLTALSSALALTVAFTACDGSGNDVDVATLAQEIIDAQQAEITQMEALLDD